MKPDEKALLEKVFSREAGAFEALLERYRALIFSVFHGPPFDFPADYIDDLYQSFVVALSAKDYHRLRAFEGRNRCSLATFLRIVATRFALDERRKWVRHPRGRGLSTDDQTGEFHHDIEDKEAANPDQTLLEAEQVDIFHNLLFSLEWKRVSVVLWVFQNVGRETIAEVMGTTRANVDALYKRAKDQMAELHGQGAGVSRSRHADDEVLTQQIRSLLRALLPVPTSKIRSALLQAPDGREALLGLVLANYPRFLCSKAEIARIAGSDDISGSMAQVLSDLACRCGVKTDEFDGESLSDGQNPSVQGDIGPR